MMVPLSATVRVPGKLRFRPPETAAKYRRSDTGHPCI